MLLPQAAFAQLPAITAVVPAANSLAAPASGPVAFTFNQPLLNTSASSLKVFSSLRGGQRAQGAAAAVVSGNTLRFSPGSAPFSPGETVSYTVTQGASSSNGALAQPRVGQFTVAVSGGNGTFTSGSDPASGFQPITVAVGDVDGDGDLDFVTANFRGPISVRLNNGSGTFGPGRDVSVSGNVRSVTLGDVDGDGDLDLLAPDYSDDTGTSVSVRFNNGQGVFSGTQSVFVNTGSYGLALGDVDGDGDLDLLTANGRSNSVSIRFNDGQGSFGGSQNVAAGSNPHNVLVGDVDADGDLDYLVANSNSSTVSIGLNDGRGNFSTGSFVSVAANPFGLAVGDVDGDGDLDLLSSSPNANGAISIRLNNGTGIFGGGQDVATNNTSGYGAFSVALGDVDGDGDLDFLASNANGGGPGSVLIGLNNGKGVFGAGQSVSVGRATQGVAVGDVDGDGDLDILSANSNDNNVSIRLNKNSSAGTGTGTNPALASLLPNIITPNNDRHNDLFVINEPDRGPWALTVYTRWGQRVYHSPNYQNDWGADSPGGTYFYLLQPADGGPARKGWVEVVR
ncbi:VCBS repeat-containing protein [Hymenobacter sp. BT523]|uniref:FG-GAP-like repeat-containing protein n=1 Tax=Hymenobacter sp. BT523 TaxID=2795725 RepID=UPI0018ED0801|nr:FG-GAP-like repeat-containing protein [Hymenobacter sp. BT523]MBJ6109236.1 VCBS repeat-containing protein [Hymenobacter sp. BT523]